MNREIKFRGICRISGKMIYGDLIHGVGHKKGKVYILPLIKNIAYIEHCDLLDGVEVIPKTVGQFIGRKDKNGKEIYEWDIMEFIYYPFGANPSVIKYYKIGLVEYYDNSFCVRYKIDGTLVLDEERKSSHHRTKKEIYSHPTQGQNWLDSRPNFSKASVIGNIYENNELLNP